MNLAVRECTAALAALTTFLLLFSEDTLGQWEGHSPLLLDNNLTLRLSPPDRPNDRMWQQAYSQSEDRTESPSDQIEHTTPNNAGIRCSSNSVIQALSVVALVLAAVYR